MAQEGTFDDSVFSNEDDVVLMNMVRSYNIKGIKNRFELSQVWDKLTIAYNKTTRQKYSKKQLQKRTSNIDYKLKKMEDKPKLDEGRQNEVELSVPNLEQQKIRVEIAKEMAEIKRAKVEDIRLQKEELLLEAAKIKLIEAQKRAEMIALELDEKKRKLNTL